MIFCRLGIAHGTGLPLKHLGRDGWLETLSPLIERDQLFVWGSVVVGPVRAFSLPLFIDRHRRESAGPMKVQIGIEVGRVEQLKGFRMLGGDCTVAHLFAHGGSVFTFHQRVVGRPIGARLRELFHQQLVQKIFYFVVDEL